MIRGIKRGERLSGRYATFSMTIAVSDETIIATVMMKNIEPAKLLSHAPASSSFIDMIIPVIEPTMNTSP